MSGQVAEVFDSPSPKRAAGAAPVHKLRVMEECRRRVQAREMRRTAIAVLGYIAECVDKETGLATLRLRTIAEATTYSRGEVGKAVEELVTAGLLKRISNRRGHECLPASFRLVDPVASGRQPRRPQATTSSPAGDISRTLNNLSPHGSNPHGLNPGLAPLAVEQRQDRPSALQDDIEEQVSTVNWDAEAEWLARTGDYRRWSGPVGGSAYEMASEDLDKWRAQIGDLAMLEAVRKAKAQRGGLGLYGDNLIDFLDPSKPRRSRANGGRYLGARATAIREAPALLVVRGD